MPAAIQINNVDAATQSIYVTGFIVLSGSYATGGDALNFATATADPSFIGMLPAVESLSCLQMDAWSMNGANINGANSVAYSIVATKAGTPSIINPSTGLKLKVAALNASPSTEHSAASYESQYTGDTIAFMAVFAKI
jgi:hypothetical protein